MDALPTDDGARWFVVQTKPAAEAKAAGHLERQDYTVYLPRYLKRRSHARRLDTVGAPLFPRYLFVRLDPERDAWRPIRSTIGVTQLVCRGDRPVPAPRGIVEGIKAREGEDGFVRLALRAGLAPGARVRVVEGPLAGLEGIFHCVSDEERVVVLLDLLGRAVEARVAAGSIEAA